MITTLTHNTYHIETGNLLSTDVWQFGGNTSAPRGRMARTSSGRARGGVSPIANQGTVAGSTTRKRRKTRARRQPAAQQLT